MSPIPDESQNKHSDYDPDQEEGQLETPDIIPPVAGASSSDENDGSDIEDENNGYMLLPQEPTEEEEEEEDGSGDGNAVPPLPSAVEAGIVSDESLTEVRGAGVDMSASVAQGNIHPAFMANYPDNKVPVHLQIPDRPKSSKQDALWNQPHAEADRLQLDSAQVSKVKSAMAGFKLPSANIPEWAQHVPEEEWKQRLFARLASPPPMGQVSGEVRPVASDSKSSETKEETVREDVCESAADTSAGASKSSG